jgi:hypothetical protein
VCYEAAGVFHHFIHRKRRVGARPFEAHVPRRRIDAVTCLTPLVCWPTGAGTNAGVAAASISIGVIGCGLFLVVDSGVASRIAELSGVT